MNLFNRIEKENEYWLVDQVKVDGVSEEDYIEAFSSLLGDWREKQIGYLSLLMDATYESWLLESGFRKVSEPFGIVLSFTHSTMCFSILFRCSL